MGGAPVLLAACGGGDDESGKPKPRSADVDVLNTALDVEHTAVAVYTAGEPVLRGPTRALGREFLDQERKHAAALVRAIEDLGGTPNKPRTHYDMPPLPDQNAFLTFARDFENTAVAAYIEALPKLTHPQLRATAAAILTIEAEHISTLLAAMGEDRVPEAFVTGEE